MLRHVDAIKDCMPTIRYHHERYDGSGYPTGIRGDEIPLDARILAVADAYDTMTSQRPYSNGQMTRKQALTELINCAGKQFDLRVVERLISLFERSNLPGNTELKLVTSCV